MKKPVYPVGTRRKVIANGSIVTEVMTENGWLVVDVKQAKRGEKSRIIYL